MGELENINSNGIAITSFFQDKNGQIWAGSLDGVYIYDGVKLLRSEAWKSNGAITGIRYSYKYDENCYYTGCEDGLYIMDFETFTFDRISITTGLDIRMIAPIDDDILLLGTMNGLVKLYLREEWIENVSEIHSHPVNSISIDKEQNIAYINGYNGFYELDLVAQTFNFISLPIEKEKAILIHALQLDTKNHSIWIGAGKRLFLYDLAEKTFTEKPTSGYTINRIMIDSFENVWIGTDKGIHTYDAVSCEKKQLVKEGTRSNRQVVKTLFEDRDMNLWIGTGQDLSLYKNNQYSRVYHWESLSLSDESNHLTALYKDSRGNFWFGGANGLGLLEPGKQEVDWYRVDNPHLFIPHNYVRSIYEDHDGELWIATDECINRFDYATKRFIHYSVMDSTMTRNADWCHSISEDDSGNLWLSAFWGGVFKVNKKKLMATEGSTYLAEENYHQNGTKFKLSSNRVQASLIDKHGNLWVPTYGYGLNKINFAADSIVLFSPDDPKRTLLNQTITCLFNDSEGYIWTGFRGGLQRIDPVTDEVLLIENELFASNKIQSISEKDGYLWLTVSDGIYALNKENGGISFMKLDEILYSCSFFDKESGEISIGGISTCISFNPNEVLNDSQKGHPVVLTSLSINNKLVRIWDESGNKKILSQPLSDTDKIRLRHNQNNLSISVADTRYNQIIKSQYLYRLTSIDEDWQVLDMGSNRISYSNLQPGKYNLTIKQIDELGKDIGVRQLSIKILPIWYNTGLAKVVYLLLFVWLIIWIANYFRVRNNLRIERIEKEKALELTEMKMDFLTNISHELKTPLSLIISPTNKLLSTAKNPQVRQLLQTVHQNSLRLSTLVHQIIDFSNQDILKTQLFLSKLEIVEFIQSVLEMYKEICITRNVHLSFTTNISQLYLEADIFKLEAVINNLMSNAIKFTPEGGNITVHIHYNEEERMLQFSIVDTGTGIPVRDLPFIFERFFQSSSNIRANRDGSGVGLSIVKDYIELHHGTIEVRSEEGQGTTFLISLPVVETSIEMEGKHESNEESENLLSPVNELKVLIVEDNIDIARFIADNLKGAICTIAHNGKHGLEQAQKLQPDIIVSDIMMPVMDGIEMSRLLKQNITTATIPIILLTAKDDKLTESEAYGIGIESFISKPLDIEQLSKRIHQITRSKSLLVSKLRQASIVEDRETPVTIESQDEKFLKEIIRIIEDKLDDSDLNVQKLSDLSGINSKQIYRRIKLLTGHTAVDYIKSIRLKKAALLLSQRKFTVAEVMYMVGFSNSSYFSKCFAEKYGVTPRQYMEN